jgi:membrane protease YdiL (CAAX protease family)
MKIAQKRPLLSKKVEGRETGFDWHLTTFWVIAFAIAWPIAFFFGVDDQAIRAAHSPLAATVIIYLPKFAFSIAGVVLFALTGQLKEMWTRLTNWRVKSFWFALAYFGPAALYLVSAWVSASLLGGQALSPRIEFLSILWRLTFAVQSGIFAYFLFRGGLGEEIGLRGFALPRLQSRHTPLKASLILGFWWGLWHLPAWMGRSVLEAGIVWLGVVAFSIIFTYFYNRTLSLPVVILLHAALNSFDDVYEYIFPALTEIDWELPYVAGILLIGIVLAFAVNRSKDIN